MQLQHNQRVIYGNVTPFTDTLRTMIGDIFRLSTNHYSYVSLPPARDTVTGNSGVLAWEGFVYPRGRDITALLPVCGQVLVRNTTPNAQRTSHYIPLLHSAM